MKRKDLDQDRKKVTQEIGRRRKPVIEKARPVVLWDEKYVKMCYQLALLGHKDHEISQVLGVDQKLFDKWQLRHPELSQALQEGRDVADARVAESLYRRALGYSHPEDHITNYKGEITITPTIKNYPPDTAAAVAWLKNRQKEKWGNDSSFQTNLNLYANINLKNIGTEDLEAAEREGMQRLLQRARGDVPEMN